MHKNQKIILIVAGIIILLAVCVLIIPKLVDRNNDSKFAIEDPELITKVFIADKKNRTTLLERQGTSWIVNGENYAFDEAVNDMLIATKRLKVRGPVSKSVFNTIVTQLANNSVKVEFYSIVYRINFLGVKLFPHEKKINSFFVGSATMDNNGTYMIKEGAQRPYIMYIPGYRGFVSPYYNPNTSVWISHIIFSSRIPQISTIQFVDNERLEESYTIKNLDSRNFALTTYPGNISVNNYDTVKIVDLLSSYSDIRYEASLDSDKYKEMNVDSIIKNTPAFVITLTDTKGIETSVKAFRIPLTQDQKDNVPIGEKEPPYNLDDMYLWVKVPTFKKTADGKTQYKEFFALGQYFVFDDITRPLSYLVKSGK